MAGEDNPFTEYLQTTGDSGAGFPLVDPDSPIQWVGLATSIFASVFTGFVFGVQAVINAFASIPTRILDAVTGVIYTPSGTFRFPGGKETIEASGIIPTVWQGILQIAREMGASFTGYGILSYPLVIVQILIIGYILNWSYSYAMEEVL